MELKNKCPYKAIYVYPWAGEIRKACELHAKAMSVLAKAIGYPMQVQLIKSKDMCSHVDDLDEIYGEKYTLNLKTEQ